MLLEIFKTGFDQSTFNKFCAEHIITRVNALDDGTVFVFYKEVGGLSTIDQIESLDKVISTAQVQILTAQVDIDVSKKKIEDMESKAAGKEKSAEDEAEIRQQKRSILMSEGTIVERNIQIGFAKEAIKKLLA